jgi:hypothetical protein
MVAEMQCINALSAGEKCKAWMVQPVAKQTSLLSRSSGRVMCDYFGIFSQAYFDAESLH